MSSCGKNIVKKFEMCQKNSVSCKKLETVAAVGADERSKLMEVSAAGKFVAKQTGTGIKFDRKARNGPIIATGKGYKTRAVAAATGRESALEKSGGDLDVPVAFALHG